MNAGRGGGAGAASGPAAGGARGVDAPVGRPERRCGRRVDVALARRATRRLPRPRPASPASRAERCAFADVSLGSTSGTVATSSSGLGLRRRRRPRRRRVGAAAPNGGSRRAIESSRSDGATQRFRRGPHAFVARLDAGHQLRLGHHRVVDLRLAAQLPDRAALAQRHDLERQLSPGTTGLRNLRLVDGHEVDDLRRRDRSRPACAASSAPACASASMISTPGITGWPGKWPSKNGSLRVTILRGDDLLVADLVDAVDEQERIAVRKDPLDGADVEHAAPTSWAGAAGCGRAPRRRRRPPSPAL